MSEALPADAAYALPIPVWAPPRSVDELNMLADLTAHGSEDRLSKYNLYRNYYDGEQNTQLTDRASQYLQVSGLRFAENVCDTVVDVMAERMIVSGFDTNEDEEAENHPVAEYIESVWDANRMDEHATTVETEKTKLGDYFVLVDWDEEREIPRIVPNKPDNMCVYYDENDPRRISLAVKKWTTQYGSKRLNVYLDDRIEKYWQPADADEVWMPHYDADDLYWPVPWTRDNLPPYASMPVYAEDGTELVASQPGGEGEARGIPVVHFRNKASGSWYGRSELRKVLPQQDALNKHVLDLNSVMDYQGWPQRWITGLDPDEVGTLQNTPGSILAVSDPDAKMGAFPHASLQEFIKALESDLQRIAALSRTPLRFLSQSGGVPSGESIKAGDAGLVSKVRKQSVADGHAWEDVMILAMRLGIDYQKIEGAPEVEPRVRCSWKDPETRNEESDWKVALLQKNVGVSTATILTERGYNAEDESNRNEADRSLAEDAQLRALTRGTPTPDELA